MEDKPTTEPKITNDVNTGKPVNKDLPKPKRSKIRVVLSYFFTLLIIILIGVGIYIHKTHHKMTEQRATKTAPPATPPALPSTQISNTDNNQAEIAELKASLQQLQATQEEINNKLDKLAQKQQPQPGELQEPQTKERLNYQTLKADEQNLLNMRVVMLLEDALNTNKPFNTELTAFKYSKVAKEYKQYIEVLDKVADQGVPTIADLNTMLNNLGHTINLYYYNQDTSRWGKVKYFLAHFITITKYKNFTNRDKDTPTYGMFYLRSYINTGNFNKALDLLNNSFLKDIPELENFKQQLINRNVANQMVVKLAEYVVKNQ